MTLEPHGTGPKCLGIRLDGEPCTSGIVAASGYCFTHDPRRDEDRARARRRGGRASSKLNRARRLAPPALLEVYTTLEQALEDVHGGKLSPSRATAMASVARAMVTVLTAGEVEERLRAVEAAMG